MALGGVRELGRRAAWAAAAAVLLLSGVARASNGLPATVTTISTSLNPAAEGQTVAFTATVNIKDSQSHPSGGQVQFKDGGVNLGAAVSLVNGQATLNTTTLTVGNHNITAVYLSNASYNGSTSNTLPEVIYNCFQEFHFSSGAITINDNAAAAPYPSTVTFSQLPGTVSRVQVGLNNISHTFPDDLDMMLSSPAGGNLVFLSDVGGGTDLVAAGLSFTDACGGCGSPQTPPDAGPLTNGAVYLPTNVGAGDAFPGPAPAPSSSTSFAGAFNGTNGNGDWKLWIKDDAAGDSGTLGGWTLYVSSGSGCTLPGTSVALAANPNPSTEGSSVTFTATLTPNTATGSVLFQAVSGNKTVTLGSATVSSGTAAVSTAVLNPGVWTIKATYSGSGSRGWGTQSVTHVRKAKRRIRMTSE